ncbi:MAG: redoxin domain-containing protein [Cytophagales bacterium]|nr:redoxin domain-containing protein [Armatimonadota bacterium]
MNRHNGGRGQSKVTIRGATTSLVLSLLVGTILLAFAAPNHAKPLASRNQPSASSAAKQTNDSKDASALLERCYAAYKELHSFSCVMERQSLIPLWTRDGQKVPPKIEVVSVDYRIQKPGNAAFVRINERGITERVVTDGQSIWMSTTDPLAQPNRHLKAAAQPGAGGFLAAIHTGRIGTETLRSVMPQVVLGINYLPAGFGTPWRMGPPTEMDGEPVDTITFSSNLSGTEKPKDRGSLPLPRLHTITLLVSKKDHLLRQIREEYQYTDGSVAVTTETYRSVRANPALASSLFTFQPPRDSVAVARQSDLYPAARRAEVVPAIGVGAVPVVSATDIDGKRVSLKDYQGKLVLLTFWGTWCAPCRAEIPTLVKAYKKYQGQGLEIVGFAIETEGATDKVRAFCVAQKASWRQVLDVQGIIANGGFVPDGVGIPYSLLIGRDGRVAAVGLQTADALEAAIQTALDQKRPPESSSER